MISCKISFLILTQKNNTNNKFKMNTDHYKLFKWFVSTLHLTDLFLSLNDLLFKPKTQTYKFTVPSHNVPGLWICLCSYKSNYCSPYFTKTGLSNHTDTKNLFLLKIFTLLPMIEILNLLLLLYSDSTIYSDF